MSQFALKLRELLPREVFTDTEIINLTDGSPDRRYALVKRAISQGELIQLRRGVYSFGKNIRREPLNLFELAQKIYPLSYISLESALSYHGWIPEAVYATTSVCLKRSRDFGTPVGDFTYTHIANFNLVEVERIAEGNAVFLMATPAKALLDFVCINKLDRLQLKEIFSSLRIDDELLSTLPMDSITTIADAYNKPRLQKFVKLCKQEIQS